MKSKCHALAFVTPSESTTATTNTLNCITYGNGLFVAVGNNGSVETSTDATNWVLQASGTTATLGRVAYGNGKFAAVGPNAVIASPDAVNWSPAVSGLTGASEIAGGGNGFVAINGGDHSYCSPDGLNWTGQTLTVPGSGYNGATTKNQIVTFAYDIYLIGATLPTSSLSSVDCIFSSADGSHWVTNEIGTSDFGQIYYSFFTSGTSGNGNLIAGMALGNMFGLTPFLQSSSDGIHWTLNFNAPVAFGGVSGTYGNGTYVIVGSQSIYTSTDGVNWTDQQRPPTPPVGPRYNITGIAFSHGIYAAAASLNIIRSSDGLVYESITNSPELAALTTFSNKFVGVGNGGKIYVSDDGLSWTQRNSGTANSLRGITISSGNGLWVAVGDGGTIQTSPTGTTWTSRISGSSLFLYGVACSGSNFVAVGQMGTVLTSLDGIAWTVQDSGLLNLNDLFSVTYGSAGFVAVGSGGTILTSPDGINWTPQNSGTTAGLESITFGNGYYLAVGGGAIVLSSPDGTTWIPRDIGATGGQSLYGSSFLNNRFVVVGIAGTILESDAVAPLFDLQIHHDGKGLTVFVPSGSNFRIQTSTNLSSGNWVDAASFNDASPITQWTNTAIGLNSVFYRVISP